MTVLASDDGAHNEKRALPEATGCVTLTFVSPNWAVKIRPLNGRVRARFPVGEEIPALIDHMFVMAEASICASVIGAYPVLAFASVMVLSELGTFAGTPRVKLLATIAASNVRVAPVK